MAHPYMHARRSARLFGGVPEDYQEIHDWFDDTKKSLGDVRHRAIRHNTHEIFFAEDYFGALEETRRYRRALARYPRWLRWLLRLPSPLQQRPTTFTRPSDQRQVPIRLIAEQHVKDDCAGKLPTIEDWFRGMVIQPDGTTTPLKIEAWMVVGARKVAQEEATRERQEHHG
jgi:uncharacterized protein DUF6915